MNALLLVSFALTAFCGMAMSNYAVPFLYGIVRVSFVRVTHLSMSHWSFVLMGLHLGLHLPVMLQKLKLKEGTRRILSVVCAGVAGVGLWLFFKNGMPNYLFFRVPFAFLDYDKAGALVLLENVVMLLFWAFVGCQITLLCRKKGNPLLPVVLVLAAIVTGLVLNMISPNQNDFGFDSGWGDAMEAPWHEAETESTVALENASEPAFIDDGFILVEGGVFTMGSPEDENWRIDDETQHEVTLSSFYIDPYETTQAEWEAIMGSNPSTFIGEKLPVENISWLEAIEYANAKSAAAGLTPAYAIDGDSVTWNRAADGYRLPTEAEWECACRAGTATPFNLERSLDADDANFYSHYPYEIEENYFDDSVLEARPGKYRGETVEVGSFTPNAWRLYDMHGNVNEWCWDWYGPYDPENTDNPTGVESGTRHVYRGGGWNDFGKNMRSAYRAAGQADLRSYNLGVRLVRNEDQALTGTATVSGGIPTAAEGGKALIAFFSWGGNTRGIAHEIRRQTGFDLFEIEPIPAYSDDYNTVLMEAQRDQHAQARPEIAGRVENMADYDTILLGYPNWWASISMPITSFLEQYGFAGKRIVPFCSHGGGRFGQSLTAIAKLAPEANMGVGLSIHYSGGSTLSEDVATWLEVNQLKGETQG
ncbi:MAG: SUMF1/EgtB/PvdO family nonheme iron enzyme [Clostridia bacterium]|nr:SUMF1/EgtB/PvdO family nonheme iron enzyme [Clostridia bacterium]